MNKEIKQQWIDALRSGNYEQARTSLKDHRNGGYCCLGVLTEIVSPGHVSLSKHADYHDMSRNGLLSWDVVEACGLKNELEELFEYNYDEHEDWEIQHVKENEEFDIHVITDDEKSISLSRKNDAGATFEEIANLIKNAKRIKVHY